MAKTVDRPMYEEFADTPYITQSRNLMDQAYGYTTNALDNYNSFINPEQYQAVADAYTQAQWNDLNRNYQQAVNQNAARERNRLGTYGASSSLYNTNTMQNYYNDLASRVASQTASQYNNLINNEYNRRLNTLINNYNTWTGAGNTNYMHDYNNWRLRNVNKDRQWQNEVDKKNWLGDKIADVGGLVGAAIGSIWGAPQVGYAVGSAAGSTIGGAMQTNQDSGGIVTQGNYSYIPNQYASPSYGQYQSNQNWLANTGIGNLGLNTSNLSDTISNAKFSWQQ